MGLAASQARLLTITARLADNELRSQTINNAKMRLATQSSQASEDYVSALNNARLMFKNVDMFGNTQTQLLNFNNLTEYSPYNTQYGLVNSAGLPLVSEKEAKLFKNANGNLDTYLESHGLKWDTNYFSEAVHPDMAEQLMSFYSSEGLDYLFADYTYSGSTVVSTTPYTNQTLQELYESYDANNLSIERAHYANLASDLYSEYKNVTKQMISFFREKVLTSTTGAHPTEEEIIADLKNLGNIGTIKNVLQFGSSTLGSSHTHVLAGYDDPNIKRYFTSTGYTEITDYVKSFNSVSGSTGLITYTEPQPLDYTVTVNPTDNNGRWEIDAGGSKKIIIEETGGGTAGNDPTKTGTFTINLPDTEYKYNGSNSSPVTGVPGTIIDIVNKLFYTAKDSAGNILQYPEHQLYWDSSASSRKEIRVKVTDQTADAMDEILEEYFGMLFSPNNINIYTYVFGDGTPGTDHLSEFPDFKTAYENFMAIYGIDVSDCYQTLLDFENLLRSEVSGTSPLVKYGDPSVGSQSFRNVVDALKVEMMIDVLGEPKYTYIDTEDVTNTGNPEAKAQWYTNLFNRMSKGYKVLEDGLASSAKWLEYAFESGLVSMEQVDSNLNWNALTYGTCSSIFQESDGSDAVAKAEAKYKRAMNDIQRKDSMYDMQLKNIDTEHNALQTEYDSIKTVITKNIERTMKFDQSG